MIKKFFFHLFLFLLYTSARIQDRLQVQYDQTRTGKDFQLPRSLSIKPFLKKKKERLMPFQEKQTNQIYTNLRTVIPRSRVKLFLKKIKERLMPFQEKNNLIYYTYLRTVVPRSPSVKLFLKKIKQERLMPFQERKKTKINTHLPMVVSRSPSVKPFLKKRNKKGTVNAVPRKKKKTERKTYLTVVPKEPGLSAVV